MSERAERASQGARFAIIGNLLENDDGHQAQDGDADHHRNGGQPQDAGLGNLLETAGTLDIPLRGIRCR